VEPVEFTLKYMNREDRRLWWWDSGVGGELASCVGKLRQPAVSHYLTELILTASLQEDYISANF
jgi:hypothetical protein